MEHICFYTLSFIILLVVVGGLYQLWTDAQRKYYTCLQGMAPKGKGHT